MNLRAVPWVEPAHPSIVRLYDDLIQVYREMKNSQRQIDAAFDRVASQIGFVVTTTIPVLVEVDEKHNVKKAELDSQALPGTLFPEAFSPLVRELAPKAFANAAAGTYRFYLVWYDALYLKLRRDWMEPAHVLQGLLNVFMPQAGIAETAAAVRPEVREPAHWFDPGIALAVDDLVAISAIDQVYPELRLADRISADRMAVRRISAYVKEPAHFLAASVRPEVREPAHPPNINAQFIAELRALLQRFGS